MNQPINIFDYENLACQNLTKMALDYYNSGAGDEVTLRDNRAVFDRWKLRPKVLVDVSQRDLSTTVLGKRLAIPILIAPMAFQCLAHPEGELATAKAAAELGTIMILSTLSTKSLEAVAQCRKNTPQWFQLYVHKDRALTENLVRRAEAAGYSALCLTVDAPLLGKRERDRHNQFTLPPGMQLANLATESNLKIPQTTGESGLFAYFAQQLDPSLTWQDLEWLQSLTKLPIAVKGILRGDDALKAVEHGAKAIIVSNHGGRQLDGAIATLDALTDVVSSVGDKAEILVDGGFRRGTDILKALALGARAVLIGRPVLWGLAVTGETGAKNILEIYRDELDSAIALCGCPRLKDIDNSLIVPSRSH
ncbi:MAG: alpha-hydroxy acid oxidase [Oscillatoria sp. PMC 1068.18]|nr:alpha-hydroxy acid oxidase [Oscillatoria sp. PMC 1076.18]MEC4989377.1 alpha-hydroxy acid oxidase [Oscillatoria sp. PMC 1068.18]